MDPFTLAITGISLAMSGSGMLSSIFGQKKAAGAKAKQASIVSQQINPLQRQVLREQQALADLQGTTKLRGFDTALKQFDIQRDANEDVFGLQLQGQDQAHLADIVRFNASDASEGIRYESNRTIDTAQYVANREGEALRQKAANLDSTRQKRQAVRAGILARSAALAQGTAQGVRGADTSLQTGFANVTSQVAGNVLGVNQQLDLGNAMFDINRSLSDTVFNTNRFAADSLFNITQSSARALHGINQNVFNINRDISMRNFDTTMRVGDLARDQSVFEAGAYKSGMDINKRISSLYDQITMYQGQVSALEKDAASGSSLAALGGGLQSMGGTLMNNLTPIASFGNSVGSYFKPQPTAIDLMPDSL